MSAYMPAKKSWSLGVPHPSRRMKRAIWRFVSAAAVILVALTIVVMVGASRTVEPALLPSFANNGFVTRGVTLERDHGFLLVKGEALNESQLEARNLVAVVELFDREGRLLNVESALIEMPLLGARKESAFVVRMPDPGQVHTYRVRFRSLGSGGG